MAGRDEVYVGDILRVQEIEMEAPDGSRHERVTLRHPGAVGVLPLHDDNTVTLVRQYRVAIDREIWEVPAGRRDVEDELPRRTAARELAEEVGLEAAELVPLTRFHNSPGCSDEVVDVFLATGLSPVPDAREGIEELHMTVARFSLDEALAMVDRGELTDAKTVIALRTVAAGPAAGL